MPANRRGRGGPRGRGGRGGQALPQRERAAPYEHTANRGMPRQFARRGSSAQTDRRPVHTHTRPTDPTVVRIPTVHVPSLAPGPTIASRSAPSTTQRQATAPVFNRESIDIERLMTEEDEDMLVQLALTWKESRKLSLSIFYADLASSFERNQIWARKSRKMQPVEAERKLQAIEMRWRSSPAFQDSGSQLARSVRMWMTDVRKVEDRERIEVELHRKRLLDSEMRGMVCSCPRGRDLASRMAGDVDNNASASEDEWNLDLLSEGSSNETDGDRNVRMAERMAMRYAIRG